MSYFLSTIKFYPNVLKYHLTNRDTALNYSPSAEPSITGETYTCSGGETSGAVYDLVDDKSSAVVTIDTNGRSTSPQIDFDLTTNATIDTLIIVNHNFSTVGNYLYVKYGGTPTTATINTAYVGSQAVTGEWQASNSLTISTNKIECDYSDGILIAGMDSFTSNNLILDIDPNSTFGADITIGEVLFCEVWTAPHAPETTGWQDGQIFGDNVYRSRGGQAYGEVLFGERKQITLNWSYMAQSDYDALKKVVRITKGKAYPLFVDLGEHATVPYLRYMRIVDFQPGQPVAGGAYWNIGLTLEEE